MEGLTVIKDIKKEVDFWLTALSNENVSADNKKLLNKCLTSELCNYLYPTTTMTVSLLNKESLLK